MCWLLQVRERLVSRRSIRPRPRPTRASGTARPIQHPESVRFCFTVRYNFNTTVEITSDTRRKLRDAVGALNMIKTGTQTFPKDPIKSAQKLLVDKWLVKPKQKAEKGADANKYTLSNSAISKKYGMLPAPVHLARYRAFTDALNPFFYSKIPTQPNFVRLPPPPEFAIRGVWVAGGIFGRTSDVSFFLRDGCGTGSGGRR